MGWLAARSTHYGWDGVSRLDRVPRLRGDLADAAGAVDLEAAVEAVLAHVVAADHASDNVDLEAERVIVVIGAVPQLVCTDASAPPKPCYW